MDFEQPYTGPVDWNFPSPTATPTSTTFAHHAFQTPKTTTFPSHFQDAFTTPQMPAYTTPRQPGYATMTPMQGQQHMQGQQYYPNMQASAGATPNQQGQVMPPPHFQPSPAAYVYSQPQQAPAAMSFDSSMQTPPPTRGSSVKKPHTQDHSFGTPSTIASRRFMTPQQVYSSSQGVGSAQSTGMQYPHLQFSPDVYQFGNMGPQTAPVFPQTQLLWGNATPPSYSQPQQPRLDDPFAPVTTQSIPWPSAPIPSNGMPETAFNTPAMGSFQVQGITRPASAGHFHPTHALPQMMPMTSAGVDPSLVYSSPARPVLPSNASNRKARPQQAEDAQKHDSSRPEHKRSDTGSTASSTSSQTNAERPQLRRSNTTGTTRPKLSDTLNRSSSMLSVPRTASPLKRSRKPSTLPLGSISETKKPPPRPRNSVVLTIDESGRASTTMTRRMITGSPTKDKSIRDRYPGLFDSDSSDEEATEDEKDDSTPSRTTSFTSLARTKSIRLDPPVENLEGLSLPRSGSALSMKVTPSRAAIAAAAQLRRGSLRKSVSSNTRTTPTSRRVSGATTTGSIDTCPMDTSTPPRGLSSGRENEDFSPDLPAWNAQALDEHNRRWSMMGMEQQQQQQPYYPHPRQQQSSVSPTHGPYSGDMSFFQSPPYGRTHQQNGMVRESPSQKRRQIRCHCGVAEERGLPLIQCTMCTQWAHWSCNPTASSGGKGQGGFTCWLCTRPSNSMGGRVGGR